MPNLHDATYRAQIVRRVQALTPDSQRRWGKMTVDQMLWHVGDALALSLGQLTVTPGTQVSTLHAKHLNHHLTQFGV